MTTKVTISNLLIVNTTIELPNACPSCHVAFCGQDNILEYLLDGVTRKGRIDDGEFFVAEGTREEDVDSDVHIVGYGCANCKEMHWYPTNKECDLEDLKGKVNSQVRDLLFDEIVRPSQCEACSIEACIGTEEVPHPVDSRLHTCLRGANELKGT